MVDKIEYDGPFYNVIFEVSEFYNILKQRYNDYARPALKSYIDSYDALIDSMSKSMKKNHSRWYSSFPSTMTDDSIEFLKKFLMRRYEVLNNAWEI